MQSILQYRKLKRDVQRQQQGASIGSELSAGSGASDDPPSEKSYEKPQEDRNANELSAFEKTTSEDGKDYIIVHFAQNDPENPRNWSLTRRIGITAIIFYNVLVLDWASACDSRLNTTLADYYGVSTVVESLDPALYLFGIAIGALFAGPITETIGRNPVYVWPRAVQVAFIAGTSVATNIQTQLVCRFFAGLGASLVLAIHGASLADIYDANGRSIAWPIVALGSFYGTVFAPVASGYIADNQSISFRWAEWIALILNGVSLLINILFLPETFAPILLKWKAEQLRKITGNNRYRGHLELQDSFRKRLGTALLRAVHMTTKEPIVLLLGAWLVTIYTVVYSNLQGFKYIYEIRYGWSESQTGSAFSAIAIGLTVSTIISIPIAYRHKKQIQKWDTGHNNESYPPENRLWPSFPAAIFFPIAMFWLGWTDKVDISPWSPLGATVLFGYCWGTIYVAIYLYILDVYTIYAGSALSTITFLRYNVSGAIVVASTPIYEALGVHYTLTIFGSIAAVLAPAPFLLYKYGDRIRQKSKFAGHHVSKSDPEEIDNDADMPQDE